MIIHAFVVDISKIVLTNNYIVVMIEACAVFFGQKADNFTKWR